MKKNILFVFFISILMFNCTESTEKEKSTDSVKVEKQNEVSTPESRSKINANDIQGRWKTDFEGTIAQLSPELKEKLGDVIPTFKQTFDGIEYEYKANGSYLHHGGIAAADGATKWLISDNILEIKENDEVILSYEILELTENLLVLKSNLDEEIFPVTVYKKLK